MAAVDAAQAEGDIFTELLAIAESRTIDTLK
jgi:hypothetical protein